MTGEGYLILAGGGVTGAVVGLCRRAARRGGIDAEDRRVASAVRDSAAGHAEARTAVEFAQWSR